MRKVLEYGNPLPAVLEWVDFRRPTTGRSHLAALPGFFSVCTYGFGVIYFAAAIHYYTDHSDIKHAASYLAIGLIEAGLGYAAAYASNWVRDSLAENSRRK